MLLKVFVIWNESIVLVVASHEINFLSFNWYQTLPVDNYLFNSYNAELCFV